MAEIIEYLRSISPCPVRVMIEKTHERFPGLKSYCETHEADFKLKPTDKGFAGKRIEFLLFGRLPNNSSEADLGELGDLKVTHVKRVQNVGYNAKERLTLTNCGSTNDYSTLQHLVQCESMSTNRLYKKLRKGVLVVLRHDGKKWTTMEQFLDTEVVAVFQYDIEALPETVREVLRTDYAKIQQCVVTNAVTQSGQVYLHIHPHGSKGSKTRALGFTNKFVTWMIAYYTGRELVQQGASWFIRNE